MKTADRPQLSSDRAAALAQRFFGVKAAATELPSERDQNFRLSRTDGPDLLLKLAHASEPVETLDLQNSILQELAASPAATMAPALLASSSGRFMEAVPYAQGHQGMARLLTFLPGRPIAEVADPSPALLRKLGAILGMVDRTLASFSHVAADRTLQWDSQHADTVIAENLPFVDDGRRDLLRHLAATASQRLNPHAEVLRKSVIHNDANDYNILVTGTGAGACVSGLIDFGDAVRTYTAAEPANCAAYAMLDKHDPLDVAAQIARGYNGAYPLNGDERQVLFDLIVIRLCLSAAIGSKQTRQDPGNTYLAVSQRPVWALLARLGAEDYQANATRLHNSIEQGPRP